MNDRFWMVLNVSAGGGYRTTPTKQHFEIGEAVAEAKRLATEHSGARFVVLESVCAYEIVQPEPTRISLTARTYTEAT
jgi:hypothetical protein